MRNLLREFGIGLCNCIGHALCAFADARDCGALRDRGKWQRCRLARTILIATVAAMTLRVAPILRARHNSRLLALRQVATMQVLREDERDWGAASFSLSKRKIRRRMRSHTTHCARSNRKTAQSPRFRLM